MEPGAPGLRGAALIAGLVLFVAACADGDARSTIPPATEPPPAGCADVIAVEVAAVGDGTHTFSVTVRSADTGWEKYADAWQVLGPDGAVLGTRELTHPHVDEQPFTRSLAGVEVPAGTEMVTVRARDSVSGWCGAERATAVPW